MIRFAPKPKQDTAPATKIVQSNAKIRSDINLSSIPSAVVEEGADNVEGQAATTMPAPSEPAARFLELSGEPSVKGRKMDSRKRKKVASPKQLEISGRGQDSVDDMLLDL